MKSVLVTGGSSDIAFAIIQSLAPEYSVTYTCSTQTSLSQTQERYQDSPNTKGMVFNFAKDRLKETFDIIILNACSKQSQLKILAELDTKQQLDYIQENIRGNLEVLKPSLSTMSENHFGRIVLISSLSSSLGTSKYSSYIMVKAALEGLIRNIAVDYGKHNICANSLQLGLFKTSRNRMFWKRKEYLDIVNSKILQNKMGEPEQVIEPIKSLIAEHCYMNGSSIELAGGLQLPNSSENS